tara:strand:- start:136 stop:867 length:732 start_codon:yes stop_codon:yes gene_type:complete
MWQACTAQRGRACRICECARRLTCRGIDHDPRVNPIAARALFFFEHHWSTALDTASIELDTAATPEVAETLDEFLAAVQARALTMARYATGSTDEALDLVQDAMCAFVRRYRDHPADQRRPIFYRCLNNRILDWHRKRTRRGRWMRALWPTEDDCADGPDAAAEAPIGERPDRALGDTQFAHALDESLQTLPLRQRQVFLLRAWEGLDVAQTAKALGVSGGSVKTHYFRALGALRSALETFDD